MADPKEINVTYLKLKEVTIPERSRIDYGDLESLKYSISNYGLLNPIILNDRMELCAGGRRLRACSELGHQTIPARIVPDLSAEDSLLIEWIENEARKEFTWPEDLQLKLKIHNSYKASNPKWGYRDTATQLGVSIGGLSTDLTIAAALEHFPFLAEYKTKGKAREAYKKLQLRADAVLASEDMTHDAQESLTKIFESTETQNRVEESTSDSEDQPNPSRESSRSDSRSSDETSDSQGSQSSLPDFAYHICDYKDLLNQIPKNSIGFAELDPPYAIGYDDTYGQTQNIKTELKDWNSEKFKSEMQTLIFELYPRMMDATWVICWCGKEWAEWLNKIAFSIGFKTQHPGIWAKPGGSSNNLDSVMVSNYETFLLFRKGTATFNTPSFNACQFFHSVPSSQKFHPTQKPLDLYQHFFKAFHRHSTIFYSPFAGSGASMVMAPSFGMKPIGSDSDQRYYYQFIKLLKESYNG